MLTAGYVYVRTSRYGDVPAKAAFPERRFFQQALIKHRADVPLPIETSHGKPFGIALYDEPFFHFGGNRGIRYLDQNRAYAAFTYKLTKSNRLEFGYLHQYVPQRNGIVSEHNHTPQFAWFSTTPFSAR